MAGRLGGVRAINRRYICDHVPTKQLTSASAAFISASALGMAVGPAVAGLLSRIDFKVHACFDSRISMCNILTVEPGTSTVLDDVV